MKNSARKDACILMILLLILMISIILIYDLNIVKKRELNLMSPNPIIVYPEKLDTPIDTPINM